jgi:hypothetical protein
VPPSVETGAAARLTVVADSLLVMASNAVRRDGDRIAVSVAPT